MSKINLPDFWDLPKVLHAFNTLDTFELYAYFGCSNSTSFTRLMKPCFPERPEKTSYSKYVRDLVSAGEFESVCVSESVCEIDPKLQKQELFEKAYKLGFFGTNIIPEDLKPAYALHVSNMKEAEKYRREG